MKRSIVALFVVCVFGIASAMAQDQGKGEHKGGWKKKGDHGGWGWDKRGGAQAMGDFFRNIQKLKKEDPERFAQLMKLRKENHKEFVQQAHELATEYKQRDSVEKKEFMALIEAYRETPSDDLKAQIREKLASEFEKKITESEERLAKIKEQYEKTKATLEKRKEQKDVIIDNKLEELLRDPDLKW